VIGGAEVHEGLKVFRLGRGRRRGVQAVVAEDAAEEEGDGEGRGGEDKSPLGPRRGDDGAALDCGEYSLRKVGARLWGGGEGGPAARLRKVVRGARAFLTGLKVTSHETPLLTREAVISIVEEERADSPAAHISDPRFEG